MKQGKFINFHNFHLSLFLQCILSLKQTILGKKYGNIYKILPIKRSFI